MSLSDQISQLVADPALGSEYGIGFQAAVRQASELAFEADEADRLAARRCMDDIMTLVQDFPDDEPTSERLRRAEAVVNAARALSNEVDRLSALSSSGMVSFNRDSPLLSDLIKAVQSHSDGQSPTHPPLAPD